MVDHAIVGAGQIALLARVYHAGAIVVIAEGETVLLKVAAAQQVG